MIRRWVRGVVERHRERHRDPYTPAEMAVFRCRLQRLIEAARS